MQIDFEALNFDATDAATLQKYLGALDAIAEKANKFDKKAPQPKQYRYLCKTVKACFDDIFGAGMGEKICGSNDSLRTCTDAIRELIEEYDRQMREQDKANEAFIAVIESVGTKRIDTTAVDGKAVDAE